MVATKRTEYFPLGKLDFVTENMNYKPNQQSSKAAVIFQLRVLKLNFMCYTPYCDGSCEECENQKKKEEQNDESCPHSKNCKWETLDIKTDRCKTCGLIINY